MIPFLLSRFARVAANPRLYIEYALVGLVIIVSASALTFYYRNKILSQSVESLTLRAEVVEHVNHVQQEVINDLYVQRTRDAEAVGKLVRDLDRLTVTDSKTRNKIHALERSNEAVRDYLNEPLPASLRCVLEEACRDGDRADSASRGSSVPPASVLRPPDRVSP